MNKYVNLILTQILVTINLLVTAQMIEMDPIIQSVLGVTHPNSTNPLLKHILGVTYQNSTHIQASLPISFSNNVPVPEMIFKNGYPVETYQVVTQDCYILTIHRIPHGKKYFQFEGQKRPVVFLQHGILCSSADWVLSTPSKGFGYILADAGYDVWMGNYRGNTYSRRHCTMDPDNVKDGFWDFTWDEMAHYDLPVMIEKVLEVTGEEDLQYIGHSMGTTAFMAMHKYRPDIGKKVRLAHLLSPVAYVGHMKSPISRIAAGFSSILKTIIMDFMGVGEFLPSDILTDSFSSLVCGEDGLQEICSNIIFILCGFDPPQINTTLLQTIFHHTPAGTSSRTLLHFAQGVNSNKFEGYNWGDDETNILHHGTKDPPEYFLDDVVTPTAVYYGSNDWFTDTKDLLRVVEGLPNIVNNMIHKVGLDTWNHLDFLWGIDADKLVYSTVLDNIKYCHLNQCRNYKHTRNE